MNDARLNHEKPNYEKPNHDKLDHDKLTHKTSNHETSAVKYGTPPLIMRRLRTSDQAPPQRTKQGRVPLLETFSLLRFV